MKKITTARTITKVAAVAATAAAGAVVFTGTASAESFGPLPIVGGSYSYNDGADRVCAKADNRTQSDQKTKKVTVHAEPYDHDRGPTRDFIDYNDAHPNSAGNTCRSLATAFENTKYKITVKSYVFAGGSWIHIDTKTRDFFS